MKAYEAFNSWATMVTGVSPRRGRRSDPSTGPDRLEGGLRRDACADPDEPATDHAADGRGGLGGADAPGGREREVALDPLLHPLGLELHGVKHGYHLLSVIVLGAVLLDVVVERTAGVGH